MAKKKKTEEAAEPVPMTLTDAELKRYEEATLRLRLHNYELELYNYKQQNQQLKKEIADLEVKLIGNSILKKREEAAKFKDAHKKFNEGVLERLGLEKETRFAYDPHTGDVDPITTGE